LSNVDIAIVAALEREINPWVANWTYFDREHGGRRYRFFQRGRVVAVSGGMGRSAARRAAEAAAVLFQPQELQSVGFAGALDGSLKAGAVVEPQRVVDSADGSRCDTGRGSGVLVTADSIAGVEQKAKLASAYGATLVDMEAAAVAKAAQARGMRFSALKAISDEVDFVLPDMESFVTEDGRLNESGFAVHAALRPWLWGRVIRLASNSSRASRALCERLREQYGL
jgi:adenosylhomocysteine nucleosidase